MSRSYKKTPAGGNSTSKSEKSDKKLWHRAFRRRNRENPEAEVDQRSVSDQWDMAKDGKAYYGDKLAKEVPRLIRK